MMLTVKMWAVDPRLGTEGNRSSNQLAAPTVEGNDTGSGGDGATSRGDKIASATVGRGAITRRKTRKVRGDDIGES